MFTAQFERFVRPARAYPQIWRLIVGVIVIAIVVFFGIAAVFIAIWLTSGIEGIRHWAVKVAEASTPTGTLLMLASFIGLAIAPMVSVRLLHHRAAGTLFGPRAIVLRDFALASGVVAVLYSLLTFGWSLYYDAIPNLELSLWLTFLPLALLVVLIQTGAEELIFRGYLQQQLAARFRSPIIWMLLPSIAFGMLHYNPESAGSNVWLIVGAAAIFGLIGADLTRITGSIGAAWGFHFINNSLAILFIAVDGTIPGLALYLTPYPASDASQLPALILVDFVGLAIAWAILRRVLRR